MNDTMTTVRDDPATKTKESAATTAAERPAAPSRSGHLTGRWTPSLALALAALLLVAAAVIGATKSRPYFVAGERSDQGAAALAAGRQLAINFVTMDYRTFDAYSAQVLNGASGPFRTQYAAKLADLKKVVVANQARSSVKRVEAGLVSSDADSAEVIVGLVSPTSNTATPAAVDKTYRLRLDLQRTSETNAPWKVIGLDFVG